MEVTTPSKCLYILRYIKHIKKLPLQCHRVKEHLTKKDVIKNQQENPEIDE